MNHPWVSPVVAVAFLGIWFSTCWSQIDPATHDADHQQDEKIQVLETVHVHGLKLNKDQQLGPVAKFTPWPTLPPALQGIDLDDWMKVRILVAKTSETTVVVLEPAKRRQLNLAGLHALKQWRFDPQMSGDDPIDGEITVRIHFRTH